MSVKHFDPSKTFKVVKYFVDGGRKFEVGDVYKPRFKSSKRAFRHWVARRIVDAESVDETKPVETVQSVTQDVPQQTEKKVDGDYQEIQTAQVVVDDGEDFQVKYQGVQFPIKRNQLREDGTLTSGGLKAYKNSLEG